MDTEKNSINEIRKIIRKIIKEDNETGINLRSLLDGELAMAMREIDFSDYNQRNDFISKIEARLSENDWISMSNGTTFTKSFTPSRKY